MSAEHMPEPTPWDDFPLATVKREFFELLCQHALLSADLAAIQVRAPGGTEAEAMRAGVRAAFAFAIGYRLLTPNPLRPNEVPSWYRVHIEPEEVFAKAKGEPDGL